MFIKDKVKKMVKALPSTQQCRTGNVFEALHRVMFPSLSPFQIALLTTTFSGSPSHGFRGGGEPRAEPRFLPGHWHLILSHVTSHLASWCHCLLHGLLHIEVPILGLWATKRVHELPTILMQCLGIEVDILGCKAFIRFLEEVASKFKYPVLQTKNSLA